MVTGEERTYYSYFAEWPPNGLLNAAVQLPASVTETSAWKPVNRVQRRVVDICIPMSQAQAEGENREDRCERVFWTVAPLNSQLWFSAQDQAVNLPAQRGVGLKAHSS